MTELFYTVFLAALVASGGVYIFYPELKQLFIWKIAPDVSKSTSEDPLDSMYTLALELYEKHYTEEDSLLEAFKLVKYKDYSTMQEALQAIENRQHETLVMMSSSRFSDSSASSNCPICRKYYYARRSGEIETLCFCNRKRFAEAIQKTSQEFAAANNPAGRLQ